MRWFEICRKMQAVPLEKRILIKKTTKPSEKSRGESNLKITLRNTNGAR